MATLNYHPLTVYRVDSVLPARKTSVECWYVWEGDQRSVVTPEHFEAMRAWLGYAAWNSWLGRTDEDDVLAMEEADIFRAIHRHYHNGIASFIANEEPADNRGKLDAALQDMAKTRREAEAAAQSFPLA